MKNSERQPKRSKPGRIDVHHHPIPPKYQSTLKGIGVEGALGVPFPKWNPDKSLEFMDKQGIKTAITSISTPGVYFKDDTFSRNLARLCNEYSAELMKDYPGRFGGFASLPLPDMQGALTEIEYSLDVLKLDGVVLMTHYGGKYLGNHEFDDLFSELNRRQAIVFIHPTDPPESNDPGLDVPHALVEAPFETTRAVTNLIYMGTMDRYPTIQYILSHGGGTIPYLAWRIALAEYQQEGQRPPIIKSLYDFIIMKGPHSGLNILKKLYYDTALTASPYALRSLQALVGSQRIVFGSDYVFAHKLAPLVVNDLKQYDGFSEEDHYSIDFSNAVRLFPRFG